MNGLRILATCIGLAIATTGCSESFKKLLGLSSAPDAMSLQMPSIAGATVLGTSSSDEVTSRTRELTSSSEDFSVADDRILVSDGTGSRVQVFSRASIDQQDYPKPIYVIGQPHLEARGQTVPADLLGGDLVGPSAVLALPTHDLVVQTVPSQAVGLHAVLGVYPKDHGNKPRPQALIERFSVQGGSPIEVRRVTALKQIGDYVYLAIRSLTNQKSVLRISRSVFETLETEAPTYVSAELVSLLTGADVVDETRSIEVVGTDLWIATGGRVYVYDLNASPAASYKSTYGSTCTQGGLITRSTLCGASSLAAYTPESGGSYVFIVDEFAHRAMARDSLGTPKAIFFQTDVSSSQPNAGASLPHADGVASPKKAEIRGSALFVHDAGNRRIVKYAFTPEGKRAVAERVIGRKSMTDGGVGDRLGDPQGAVLCLRAGAVGSTFFVADAAHHRVLGYHLGESGLPSSNGLAPDLVLGQATLEEKSLNTFSSPTRVACSLDGRSLFVLARPVQSAASDPTDVYFFSAGPSGFVSGQAVAHAYSPSESGSMFENLFNPFFGDDKMTDIRSYSSASSSLSGQYLLVLSRQGKLVRFPITPTGLAEDQAWIIVDGATAGAASGQSPSAGNAFVVAGDQLLIARDLTPSVEGRYFDGHVMGAASPLGTAFTDPQCMGLPEDQTTEFCLRGPSAVALTDSVWIADTGNNRVGRYKMVDKTQGGPVFLGQDNGQSGLPNKGTQASIDGLSAPSFVGADLSALYVVDSGNNRVLFWQR